MALTFLILALLILLPTSVYLSINALRRKRSSEKWYEDTRQLISDYRRCPTIIKEEDSPVTTKDAK